MRWYNASAYYAIAVSQALSNRGHKVIVAGDYPSPPLEKAQQLRLQIYQRLNLSRLDHSSILQNLKGLSQIIKKEQIGVINAHRGEGHFYASLLKKIFNPKLA
ncbi:MAG TPA: glycosyltransferase, partial [candidate division Zixibacteria bacterium]|nr:glycosyltransferase [candidate division Zixibacteria bacterium]